MSIDESKQEDISEKETPLELPSGTKAKFKLSQTTKSKSRKNYDDANSFRLIGHLSSEAWCNKSNPTVAAATLPDGFTFKDDGSDHQMDSVEGCPETSAMEMLEENTTNSDNDRITVDKSASISQNSPLTLKKSLSSAAVKNNLPPPLISSSNNHTEIVNQVRTSNFSRLTSNAWCNKNNPDQSAYKPLPKDFTFCENGDEEGNPKTSAFYSLSGDDHIETAPTPAVATAITSRSSDSSFGGMPNRDNARPHEQQQVEEAGYRDIDVLLGRGGMTNKHPGNKRFREQVRKLKQWYKECETKKQKKNLSELMVASIHSEGGRFMTKGGDGKWVVADPQAARKKASQALREEKKK